MIYTTINNLRKYQQELEDSFKLNVSKEDMRTNPDAKELAKKLKKQRKVIDKVCKMLEGLTE